MVDLAGVQSVFNTRGPKLRFPRTDMQCVRVWPVQKGPLSGLMVRTDPDLKADLAPVAGRRPQLLGTRDDVERLWSWCRPWSGGPAICAAPNVPDDLRPYCLGPLRFSAGAFFVPVILPFQWVHQPAGRREEMSELSPSLTRD